MKTNEEWRLWGDRDPLWGVASWPGRNKDGGKPWTDGEFYDLGDDWLDFSAHWKGYGLTNGIAVEIGCGAGRITNRLSKEFVKVIACDVSEGMVNYAMERIHAQNVVWMISDGIFISVPDDSVDAVFSCHVLQHMESNAAQLACFQEIHRILSHGGSMLVHIPIHQFVDWSPRFAKIARFSYRLFLALSNVKAGIRRAMMRIGGPLYMHGVSYDQATLYADLMALGFKRIEFRTFPVRTNAMLHTCVFGTKT